MLGAAQSRPRRSHCAVLPVPSRRDGVKRPPRDNEQREQLKIERKKNKEIKKREEKKNKKERNHGFRVFLFQINKYGTEETKICFAKAEKMRALVFLRTVSH